MLSRRAVLALVPGSLAAAAVQGKKQKELPRVGEFVRLLDPVTESPLVRLTSTGSNSRLPAPANRFLSTKERVLVFSSDRSGHFAPYSLDLRSGAVRPIAETTHLEPETLCLDETERSLYFVDNGQLKEIQLQNKKERTLAEGISAFALGSNPNDTLVVRGQQLQTLEGATLAEDVASGSMIRPHRNGVLFTRMDGENKEFCYIDLSSPSNRKVSILAKGNIRFPFWSSDGQYLLFLRYIQRNEASIPEIHSISLDPCSEENVAPTSQFASFAPNRDQSVFVGASSSKAQPDITLLLRSPQREMTLCEHRAKDASTVCPVFSPDSRRVYFQSDREGKSAIYTINVEQLVEPTLT